MTALLRRMGAQPTSLTFQNFSVTPRCSSSCSSKTPKNLTRLPCEMLSRLPIRAWRFYMRCLETHPWKTQLISTGQTLNLINSLIFQPLTQSSRPLNFQSSNIKTVSITSTKSNANIFCEQNAFLSFSFNTIYCVRYLFCSRTRIPLFRALSLLHGKTKQFEVASVRRLVND